MKPLLLHDWHQSLHATFGEVNGMEVVRHYGDPDAEHTALHRTVGLLDLSHRGRLCLTGADRARFLNGQVTNNITALDPGDGCYAALVTAKAKMESDLNVYCLADELLLDFEPGLTDRVIQRLEKYIVADQVEVAEIDRHYGLLSLQGPRAAAVLNALDLCETPPATDYSTVVVTNTGFGDVVIACLSRFGTGGFDLFIPAETLRPLADKLSAAARKAGGGACGWDAMEMARIEAGIPRYGLDMDDTIIPLEAGLEQRAVRYDKGCYIGQEVINRIHSVGRVTKSLRGLVLPDALSELPRAGDKLLHHGRPVGFITSSHRSRGLNQTIALGYVRTDVTDAATPLTLATGGGEFPVAIVDLPFSGVRERRAG